MNFLLDFLWEILADRGIYCLNLEVFPLKLNQNDTTTRIPQEFSDVYFSIAKLPHKLLAVPFAPDATKNRRSFQFRNSSRFDERHN